MNLKDLLDLILAGESPVGVIELCLDYAVTRDYAPEKVSVIGGLEAFSDLESLSLSKQALESPKGLPDLPNLRGLVLDQNELETLHGFPNLSALHQLDLSYNLLQSLDGLPPLPALEIFQLNGNHLEDVSALVLHENLRSLSLSGNRKLKNPESLSGLPKLASLYLLRTFIGDWDFLRGLKSLRELAIQPVHLKNLPWDALEFLEVLHLQMNRAASGVVLGNLPNLRELRVTRVPAGISFLQLPELPVLEVLNLSGCHLRQLPAGIEGLKKLRVVDLRNNGVEGLAGLRGCENLERIFVGNCPLDGAAVDWWVGARPEVEMIF